MSIINMSIFIIDCLSIFEQFDIMTIPIKV